MSSEINDPIMKELKDDYGIYLVEKDTLSKGSIYIYKYMSFYLFLIIVVIVVRFES